MTIHRISIGVFCLLLGSADGRAGAQVAVATNEQVTFRSSANYVEVSVQARDRNGRPVTDLTATDIQVFEDGVPQQIATFSRVELPVRRTQVADAASVPLSIGETTWTTNTAAVDGRTFVLLVDAMHIAAERTAQMRRLLRRFVLEHMGANDLAAVVVTGGLSAGQDFTRDKALLVAAIDRAIGDRLPSRMLTKLQAEENVNYQRDRHAGERAFRAQQSLISLRRVVQMLGELSGRRTAVVYVSEGFDIDLHDRIGRAAIPHMPHMIAGRIPTVEAWDNTEKEANYAGQVTDELQLTVEASTRANVAVYTVDPRGLADGSEMLIHIRGLPDGSTFSSSLMRAESNRMQHFLRDLASRTGGRAVVSTNEFDGPFREIVEDASRYYVLTYRTTPRTDGRFRRIAVRTSRPDITISARDGYYAPRRGAEAERARSPLAALLESPIQLPGLAMSAASTVLPGPDAATVRFAVEFEASSLAGTDDAPPVIHMAYILTDDRGRVRAEGEKTLTLAVSTDMRSALATLGLRYIADVAVPPGRHHMRFAAQNRTTQALGSLFWTLDVPATPTSDVTVSPLIVSSEAAERVPTITDLATTTHTGESLITAQRAFGPHDILSISTLVAAGKEDGLTAEFVVSTAAGHEVARQRYDVPTTAGRDEVSAFTQRVTLDALVNGRYRAAFVLRGTDGRVRTQRVVDFDVTSRQARDRP